MVASLASIAVSGVIALQGSVEFFAISWVFLMLGASHITVSGHAWISARAPYERRARFLGIFETSWALGLLIGAPTMALLIGWFGWRGPFVAVSGTAALGALMIARMVDTPPIVERVDIASTRVKLSGRAWVLIGASAGVAMTGLAMIVVTGTWLTEKLGVTTGGLGLVAMAFGVAELSASSASAAFADRIGKRRSTRAALIFLLAGLAVMSIADPSLLVGGLGLVLFFLGFEYAIVTTFSLVSEAMPAARGRTLATNSAIGTVARGAGAIAAGLLYERYGIQGAAILSAIAATIAIMLLTIAGRSS
jgi:DHA1 family inner membrane transport protein